MCWSFSASLFFAIVGFLMMGYLAFKKKSYLLWIPIGYLALMELLQAITYLHLGSCTPTNQILTLLAYLHISFQPFFVNMFSMYFIPPAVRQKVSGFVYALCFLATIFLLVKLYPFAWAGTCPSGEILCGQELCSTQGNWYLAWHFPLNDIGPGFIAYTLSIFILPLLYGSWKTTALNFFVGPLLIYTLVGNLNEAPAIWCLFSILMIAIVLYRPVRKMMRVRKWYFWNYPK